jgi:sugar/nucleoside kinase (ribokinase family)
MLDVITIGTATRDTFLKGEGVRVLKDPLHLRRIGFPTGEAECFALGAKLEVGRPVVSVGGGAANTAVTFARQGFRTASLVRLGTDEAGEAVISDLRREKITPFAIRDPKLGTAASSIILAPNGERTILVYRGASEKLTRREVPWAKLRARWAYVTPGGIAYPLILELVRTLKSRGAKIAMNPSRDYLSLGKARTKRLYELFDVVVMNREEAASLTGVAYRDEQALFKKLDVLVPGIAVMTDGVRGSLVSDGAHRYRAGVFRERAKIDRTGAGDAFGSGFVAGLMKGAAIPEALRIAAANATSVVEQVGSQAGILTTTQYRALRWERLSVRVERVR